MCCWFMNLYNSVCFDIVSAPTGDTMYLRGAFVVRKNDHVVAIAKRISATQNTPKDQLLLRHLLHVKVVVHAVIALFFVIMHTRRSTTFKFFFW